MPEKDEHEFETAMLKLKNTAREYVREGSTLAEKQKRKEEMAELVENLVKAIIIHPDCPYGMHWDPITGTCKI
jgi:hypothetical protein